MKLPTPEQMNEIAEELTHFFIINSSIDLMWHIHKGYLGDASNLHQSVLGDWFDDESLDHLMAVGFENQENAEEWLKSHDEATYTCLPRWVIAKFGFLERCITSDHYPCNDKIHWKGVEVSEGAAAAIIEMET